MKPVLTKFVVAAAALLSVSVVSAQGMAGAGAAGGAMGGAMQRPAFATVDTDGDGKVTLVEFVASVPAEMQARAENGFARMDVDTDGFLTEAEYSAMPARQNP